MNKIILTAAIFISCLFLNSAKAQIHVSLGINIGAQPEWGPVGYDHADYYYMPDIGVYYDVPAHQYVYFNNNAWVRGPYLPARYQNYDVYHSYKVVINQPRPWVHDADYRVRYAAYRGRHDQAVIRDSRDDKYRNHWHDNGQHRGWDKHDRGNGGDDNRGHGHGHGDDDKGHGHGHD